MNDVGRCIGINSGQEGVQVVGSENNTIRIPTDVRIRAENSHWQPPFPTSGSLRFPGLEEVQSVIVSASRRRLEDESPCPQIPVAEAYDLLAHLCSRALRIASNKLPLHLILDTSFIVIQIQGCGSDGHRVHVGVLVSCLVVGPTTTPQETIARVSMN